jgi:nicotinate-nucleotide adenylyltransferase
MAEAARKEYKLLCVYFIPCGIPPHKPKDKMLPKELRYELVKKAIKGEKYFRVLDIEIKKKKPAYTIDTIKMLTRKQFQRVFVGASRDLPLLCFLIGADEFEKLHKWKKPNELARLVHFLVLPRLSKKIRAPKIKGLKWSMVHTKPINISSSEIRKKLNKGGGSFEKSIFGCADVILLTGCICNLLRNII